MKESELEIKRISFEEIFPIWRDQLWPQRKDPIRTHSSMTLEGQYDMSIYQNSEAIFLGIFDGRNLIAVNSCHLSSTKHLRSRGLYVHPLWRGQGLAGKLLRATFEEARSLGAELVWSYPRQEALQVYLRQGFEETAFPPRTETNSYVIRKI